MTIQLDSVATGKANATSVTYNHTVASGVRILVVSAAVYDLGAGAPTISSVTYNSIALNSVVTAITSDNYTRVGIFYLINPPSGTYSVVVTGSAAVDVSWGASSSWFGVNTGSPIRSSNSATGTSITPSVAITSVVGDRIIDSVGNHGVAISAVGTGQTIFGAALGDATSASYEIATGTSTTMSWTQTSAQWAIAGVSLIPAQASNILVF